MKSKCIQKRSKIYLNSILNFLDYQNHDQIAKAVMNEIEELKKVEESFYSNPYITPRMTPIKSGN